jgi:hypothetical protein
LYGKRRGRNWRRAQLLRSVTTGCGPGNEPGVITHSSPAGTRSYTAPPTTSLPVRARDTLTPISLTLLATYSIAKYLVFKARFCSRTNMRHQGFCHNLRSRLTSYAKRYLRRSRNPSSQSLRQPPRYERPTVAFDGRRRTTCLQPYFAAKQGQAMPAMTLV